MEENTIIYKGIVDIERNPFSIPSWCKEHNRKNPEGSGKEMQQTAIDNFQKVIDRGGKIEDIKEPHYERYATFQAIRWSYAEKHGDRIIPTEKWHEISPKRGINTFNTKSITESQTQNSIPTLPFVSNAWIFQADPKRYDILNALNDKDVVNGFHWRVSRYKNEILKGHVGLIWLSGEEAGIYAATEIISEYPQLFLESDAEKKYWNDITNEEGEVLRVKMKLIKNLINNPITKVEIINKTGLKDLSIIKLPRGTNFRVTSDEWNILKGLIDK